jgi:hypothetical protein
MIAFKVRKCSTNIRKQEAFGLRMIKNQIESMGDSINIANKSRQHLYIEFKNQK